MYLWIGCRLPETFETDLRCQCLKANQGIGADTAGFSLPQHISLKISFDAGQRCQEILEAVCGMLEKEKKFYVNLGTLELEGDILWVTVKENSVLRRLHDSLDRMLLEDYAIPRHPYDREFRFHSTLFVDSRETLGRLYEKLSFYPPGPLPVDTFLLGTSPTGAPGSYRVVRTVKIS